VSIGALDLYSRKIDRPILIDAETMARAEMAEPVGVSGFEAMMSLEYRADIAKSEAWRNRRHYELTENAIDEARRTTGKTLTNPHGPPAATGTGREREMSEAASRAPDFRAGFGGRWGKFLEEYEALREFNPGLPDPNGFQETVAAEVRKRVAELKKAEVGSTSLGDIGGFIGGAGAEMQHPVNIMTLPFGAPSILYAPARAGIMSAIGRVAAVGAIESGIAVGAQAVIGAERLDRLPALGVQYGRAEFIEEMKGAAVAGFVLGGGLRTLVAGWRAVRGTKAAENLPPLDRLAADDGAVVAERLTVERAAIAPVEAMNEARRAVAAGERVEVGSILTTPPAIREQVRGIKPAQPRLYHGTTADIDRFDVSKARGGPYGPGIYLTENREIASAFAEEAATRPGAPDFGANVTMASANIRNPFRIDKKIGAADVKAIGVRMTEHGFPAEQVAEFNAAFGRGKTIGDKIYAWLGARRSSDPAQTNNILRASGFDGITVMTKTGVTPHRLWVAFDADKVQVGMKSLFAEFPPTSMAKTAQAAQGTAPTFTSAGRRVDLRYELTDLRSLIPSHTDELRPNAAYPESLQPRDRTRAASEAQIAEIAGKLNPERMGKSADASSGAPIVGPDNLVESGNARVLALRRASPERLQAYRAWLESQGYDTTGIANPVLIGRRTTAMSDQERLAFVREANAATAARMGAAEQAASDAEIVQRFAGVKPDDLKRLFLQALPASERGALVTKSGALSQAGERRIQAATIHAAYGDTALVARLAENTADDLKSIGGALLDNASDWAAMRAQARAGTIAPDVDRTADLMGALHLVERAKKDKIKMSDVMEQGALFDSPEATRLFVAMFHVKPDLARMASRATIGERLAGYIDGSNKTSPDADLFGAPPARAEDILLANDGQRSMVAAAEGAKAAREALPKAAQAVDSAVEATKVTIARQTLLDEDFTMAVQVGDATVMRSAREVFAEADDAVKTAQALRNCAIGSAI
jgi:hypothetical protein